jgi:ribosomal protein S18 acetylase RimI-like enzyme
MNISEEDIEFVETLMSANSDALGFIPTKGIRTIAAEGGLMILHIHNTQVGYLLCGPIKPNQDVTVYQVCIDKDLRRTGGGRDLLLKLRARATSSNAKGIRLRCASDLEANGFWQALGFKLMSTDKPRNRRKRPINTYYLALRRDMSSKQLELFNN